MKNFIAITLQLLAAHLLGILPAPLSQWRISRKDYNGSKLPIEKWAWIATAKEFPNGEASIHILHPKNGLWDATKGTYLGMSGWKAKHC